MARLKRRLLATISAAIAICGLFQVVSVSFSPVSKTVQGRTEPLSHRENSPTGRQFMINVPRTEPADIAPIILPEQFEWDVPKEPELCLRQTQPRLDVGPLLKAMGSSWHWQFIASRIHNMWPHWTEALRQLCDVTNCTRTMKRVTVLPGVLELTHFARPETIAAGGPLGDLIQWADLIACLYLLGHDLTLYHSLQTASKNLPSKEAATDALGCSTLPDLFYVDIMAYRKIPKHQQELIKCRVRVIDAYGTEAMYNDREYAENHGLRNMWAMFGLNLKQFMTFYPHTPDNSFLGFTAIPPKEPHRDRQNVGIVYGKEARYLQGKQQYLEALLQYMKLVANLPPKEQYLLPDGVENLGVVGEQKHKQIMNNAKFLVGLGDPLESTGVVNALMNGCIFLNPSFKGDQKRKLKGKPTSRDITSQVTYLEQYVGRPHVVTLDITNLTEVHQILKEIINQKVSLPPLREFTPIGFLERLDAYIRHQDFCSSGKPWPPADVLVTRLGQQGQSCSSTCRSAGLICEPAFFPLLNQVQALESAGFDCNNTGSLADLFFPAFIPSTHKCVLQSRPILFSCAGGSDQAIRLCPCRTFIRHQVALCEGCL